jgi:Domain of unknown function (DU1801)
MAELKTKKNNASVTDFLDSVRDEQKRRDSFEILNLMKEISGEEPKMWGSSIIGFGQYHYKYQSGREGDWMKTGFSPRKQNLTIYAMCDVNKYSTLLAKLGKHKTGKGCLYINKLDDVNPDVLKELVTETFVYMSNKYD